VVRWVIELDHGSTGRILHLRQPCLADEATRVRILETDPDTRNLKAGRHFQRYLDYFVSATLSLISSSRAQYPVKQVHGGMKIGAPR